MKKVLVGLLVAVLLVLVMLGTVAWRFNLTEPPHMEAYTIVPVSCPSDVEVMNPDPIVGINVFVGGVTFHYHLDVIKLKFDFLGMDD